MSTAVATEHEQAEDRERVGGDAEAAQAASPSGPRPCSTPLRQRRSSMR